MEPAFWRERWKEGRIGFHQGRPNAFLEEHHGLLPASARVFVPLCGKAEDMAFLASQGHDVVGVDLVESAIADFFREHGVEPVVTKDDRIVTYRGGPFTLYAGDFFALRRDDLEDAACAYDRAAIVALPPDMRVRYAAHLRTLLPTRAPILTVTFDYDESGFSGPPFSVGEAELRRVYGDTAEIALLATAPLSSPGAVASADPNAAEKCWLVAL